MPWQNMKTPYGGKRTPWGLAGGGPANIIQRHNWDVEYWGSDCTGTPWPEHNGQTSYDLVAGSAATTGVSTSGLTSAGLPAALVNNAVTPNSAAGFTDATWNWPSSNFWHRILVDLAATVINGDRLMWYVVSGTQYAEIRIVSEENITFTVRDPIEGIFTVAAAGGGFPTGWLLLDWWVSGVSMGVYVNGVNYSPSDTATAKDFQNGSDSIGFTCAQTGTLVADGNYLFGGWMWDSQVTLQTHRDDAESVGLYTP